MIGEFFLRPLRGAFDLDQIREFFDLHPYTAPDPIRADTFIVCGDNATLQRMLDRRRGDTHDFSPPDEGCVVMLDPREILVNQYAKPLHRRNCRPFVEWLLRHYPCRVTERGGRDLTKAVRLSLDVLYRGDPPSTPA